MIRFAFLCVILLTGHHYAVGFLDHDYEYVPEADTWIRLNMVRDYWADARHHCQLEGGILASPSSSALAEAMVHIMSTHKVTEAFTGIHAMVTEGEFESLDGVPLSEIPLDWSHDKPNEHYNRQEHCTILNATGKINDVGCTYTYPYFCRKESAVMNATHECRTTVSGYQLEPRTGSCYKFHQGAQQWHHAARICHAEGSHLAIINSDIESQVLVDIFKKNPEDSIEGAEKNDAASIGVWKWGLFFHGQWQTVHGQSLKEAGFAKWSDISKEELKNGYAAAVNRNGLLVPIKWIDQYSFICEITP